MTPTTIQTNKAMKVVLCLRTKWFQDINNTKASVKVLCARVLQESRIAKGLGLGIKF